MVLQLKDVLKNILKQNQKSIAQAVDVLIEQQNPQTGELIGRSSRFAPEVDGLIYIEGDARLGSMVKVQITDADVYDLYGYVLE